MRCAIPTAKRERLLKVAAEEPDMSHAELASRFGLSPSTVTNLLSRAGITRQRITLSAVGGQTHGALKRAIAKYRGAR